MKLLEKEIFHFKKMNKLYMNYAFLKKKIIKDMTVI